MKKEEEQRRKSL